MIDVSWDLDHILEKLEQSVLDGVYRPSKLLGVRIPKRGGGSRLLAIPTVRDRILHTSFATALTPILEREFEDQSYGFRPGRFVRMALDRIRELRRAGYRYVLDADIEAFFDEVHRELLFEKLLDITGASRLVTQVHACLAVAIVIDGKARMRTRGIPQGSPLSPLLANLYLDQLDEAFGTRAMRLVRYADDFVVLTKSRQGAEAALDLSESILDTLQLSLAEEKTRVTSFDEGFRFIGQDFVGDFDFKAPRSEPEPRTRAALDAEDDPDKELAASIATRPMLRTLYLSEQGLRLARESRRFVARAPGVNGEKHVIPAIEVDQVLLFGNVQITTQAMRLCFEQNIPLHFLTLGGRSLGISQAHGSTRVEILRRQLALLDDDARRLALSRAIVYAKLSNSETVLRRRMRRNPSTALSEAVHSIATSRSLLGQSSSLEELRGYEGLGARQVFSAWKLLLDPQLGFTGRQKRPPRDPVNAVLSFAYAALHANCVTMLRAARLDPDIGILHEIRPGHAALASDLIEEFRAPAVEAPILTLFARGSLRQEHFEASEDGRYFLTTDGRRIVLRSLERAMSRRVQTERNGRAMDLRRILARQAETLRHCIVEEDRRDYPAFRVR